MSASLFEVAADPTGASDSTAGVQAAIDAAGRAGGGVVHFPEGLFRIDGVLTVRTSSVVLRGEGPALSRLHFTRHMGLSYGAHLTFAPEGGLRADLEVPLSRDGPSRAMVMEVADARGLAAGDDVAIGWTITPEFVADHGMTGTWRAFNGTWQPFFWRRVTAIDRSTIPQRVAIDVPLRYRSRVRDGASLRRMLGWVRECGVEALGVANAVGWAEAWAEDQVHAIAMSGVADCWIRDVASFPSPGAPRSGLGAGAHLQSSGILVHQSKRVTIAGTRLELAQNRGGGGNGYLFEIRQSGEVLVRDSVGRAGRHNFIQNWGFGATGNVFLRIHSLEGLAQLSMSAPFGTVGLSEFHHSLATANLIDQSTLDDGWGAVNRGTESTGAGHTATENVFWNVRGAGVLRSFQYRTGYVIGTGAALTVIAAGGGAGSSGTSPEDVTEGLGAADTLVPASLYEEQLSRRLGP